MFLAIGAQSGDEGGGEEGSGEGSGESHGHAGRCRTLQEQRQRCLAYLIAFFTEAVASGE